MLFGPGGKTRPRGLGMLGRRTAVKSSRRQWHFGTRRHATNIPHPRKICKLKIQPEKIRRMPLNFRGRVAVGRARNEGANQLLKSPASAAASPCQGRRQGEAPAGPLGGCRAKTDSRPRFEAAVALA